MLTPEEQLHIIKSGTAQIVPESALLEKLKRGVPLNVEARASIRQPPISIWVTRCPCASCASSKIWGIRVTLIIGDGTALIGDPSGRNTTRPQLSPREDPGERPNLRRPGVQDARPREDRPALQLRVDPRFGHGALLKLLANFTVARILERDDFHNRYTSGQSISLHEFLYPVMQAYDSVVIKADVELGGTDQLFNLLAGRELMEKMGMEPQVCLTLPLLEGTDGVKKMSKSYGNYIGLTDEPSDMFGKVMSIPDELMVKYYRLASTEAVDEIDRIEAGLAADQPHPNKVKRALARNIVTAYYDDVAAEAAEADFDLKFKEHGFPADAPIFAPDLTPDENGLVYVAKILVDAGRGWHRLRGASPHRRRRCEGQRRGACPQSLQRGSRGSRRRRGAGGEEEVRALRVAFEAGVSVLRFAG